MTKPMTKKEKIHLLHDIQTSLISVHVETNEEFTASLVNYCIKKLALLIDEAYEK